VENTREGRGEGGDEVFGYPVGTICLFLDEGCEIT
jgi:hypothetical protein